MEIYSILICISFISSSIEHIFNVTTYFFSRELGSSFLQKKNQESFEIRCSDVSLFSSCCRYICHIATDCFLSMFFIKMSQNINL